jgi:AbiV family abortive infection protein
LSKGKIQIPVDQTNSQLDRIAANVRRLIADSRILVKDGSRNHAAAMSVFALEELVKYCHLKEERKAALAAGQTNLDVDELIFGIGHKPHEHKLKKAKEWQLIPDDAWEVHKGSFDSRNFSSRNFDTDVVLSATLRIESIFVDWDRKSRCWFSPPNVEIEKLEYFNESVLKALNKAESEL